MKTETKNRIIEEAQNAAAIDAEANDWGTDPKEFFQGFDDETLQDLFGQEVKTGSEEFKDAQSLFVDAYKRELAELWKAGHVTEYVIVKDRAGDRALHGKEIFLPKESLSEAVALFDELAAEHFFWLDYSWARKSEDEETANAEEDAERDRDLAEAKAGLSFDDDIWTYRIARVVTDPLGVEISRHYVFGDERPAK